MEFTFDKTLSARGSVHAFPVQLAPDGTPCIAGPSTRSIGPGKTEIVFYPPDHPAPAPYPVDEATALYAVRPGDFIGVYTRTPDGLTIQSFRIETVHSEHLIAILADASLLGTSN